jgi:predicted transcriptional regulator
MSVMTSPVKDIAPIFDDPDEQAEDDALAVAEAQIAAGQSISHDAMVKWLLSWGTADELPPPECGQ